MFEQTFLEKRRRNPWATLLSFAIDSVLVGTLVLLPLLSTGAAPSIMRYIDIGPPPGPDSEPPAPRPEQPKGPQPQLQSEFDGDVLRLPPSIPRKVTIVNDPLSEESPALPPGSQSLYNSVTGGTGLGGRSVIDLMPVTPRYVPPPPVAAEPALRRVVVGGVIQQARAIFQPDPVYPVLARQARISGRVRLAAVISEQGTIEALQVLEGHPLLIKAAIEAVRQWRYRPLILNGNPSKVDTTINVNFTLQ